MEYNGPGRTGELTGDLLAKWQATLSDMFESGVARAFREAQNTQSEVNFFNPLMTDLSNSSEVGISWTAFPKRLTTNFPDPRDGWRESDRRREAQEEYCEWTVVREPGSPSIIKRIVFTTETPDYYDFLARHDRQLLLDVYRRFVSPTVQLDDLIVAGRYDALNRWNHPGSSGMDGTIMHMGGNSANTLGAAIALSAEATWPSIDEHGAPITAEQALIACRQFGDPARHSDPFIGAQVNQLVRLQKLVSLAAPVGLYIDDIDFSEFEIPSGLAPTDIFRIERGTEDFMMRVVFEAPIGSGFQLSDVKIGGESIAFGGQIAAKMRIRIRGLAIDAANLSTSIPCDGQFRPVAPLNASRRPFFEL